MSINPVGGGPVSATTTGSADGRYLMLIAAFLGWMFAGVELSIMVPVNRSALQEFFSIQGPITDAITFEILSDQWFSWFITAFLLGAATGGALFGWLGDRIGRVKALGLSIICYSVITGLSYFVTGPEQLLVLRFLAMIGVGGSWPNGMALVSEGWPKVSRPMIAGLIGMSANIGFLLLGVLMLMFPVNQETWRWVLLFGATPVVVGTWVLIAVPESPKWLQGQGLTAAVSTPIVEVFKPPLLRLTILGIFLGSIPLLGGWASGQRLVPWAGKFGEVEGAVNLMTTTQILLAIGLVIGSFSGGFLVGRMGPRRSYFMISLFSWICSIYVFRFTNPGDPGFFVAVVLVGIFGGSFYGWLPSFLPYLFPTQVRATGSGVSFNFGRILSAVAIFLTSALAVVFQGDIAKMGFATCFVYAAGMIIIWFIPDKTEIVDE